MDSIFAQNNILPSQQNKKAKMLIILNPVYLATGVDTSILCQN